MSFNINASWSRGVFSLKTVIFIVGAFIIPCADVYFDILQHSHNYEGELLVRFNGKQVPHSQKRTALVYLDKDTVDIKQYGILPQLMNPTKYVMKDVHIEYTVSSIKSKIVSTDYYSLHRVGNKSKLDNKDKTLYAKTEIPEVFSLMRISNGGVIDVQIRATYNGIEQPFMYNTHIVAKKLRHTDIIKRRELILNNAYGYTVSHSTDTVDIYILNGNRAEIMYGVSKNRLREYDKTNRLDSKEENIVENTSEITGVTEVSTQKGENYYDWLWYVEIIVMVLLIIGATIGGFYVVERIKEKCGIKDDSFMDNLLFLVFFLVEVMFVYLIEYIYHLF